MVHCSNGSFCPDVYKRQLEEYRSKGLGSEYFRYMEEHKEEGVTRFRLEVEKENERAWKLYKRQGYDWLEYDQMIKEFC